MKEASNSDRVTSMAAPTASDQLINRYLQQARGRSPHRTEQSPREASIPPAFSLSLSHTIVSRCPVSLNTGFQIKKTTWKIDKNCWWYSQKRPHAPGSEFQLVKAGKYPVCFLAEGKNTWSKLRRTVVHVAKDTTARTVKQRNRCENKKRKIKRAEKSKKHDRRKQLQQLFPLFSATSPYLFLPLSSPSHQPDWDQRWGRGFGGGDWQAYRPTRYYKERNSRPSQ